MDIKVIDRPGGPKGKLYYELRPYYHQDCKIVTPVDSDKTVIRPLLTRDEALCLIDRIQGVKEMEVTQDKQREERYKEALKTCDCHVWVSMIKAAEENLYSELALSLEIPREKVADYIKSRVSDGEQAWEGNAWEGNPG